MKIRDVLRYHSDILLTIYFKTIRLILFIRLILSMERDFFSLWKAPYWLNLYAVKFLVDDDFATVISWISIQYAPINDNDMRIWIVFCCVPCIANYITSLLAK